MCASSYSSNTGEINDFERQELVWSRGPRAAAQQKSQLCICCRGRKEGTCAQHFCIYTKAYAYKAYAIRFEQIQTTSSLLFLLNVNSSSDIFISFGYNTYDKMP